MNLNLNNIGVTQGSILGPFLFLIYINDLPHFLKESAKIVLFADDTSLIFKINRKQNDSIKINETLKCVSDWFSANNLLLNSQKTKCIKFILSNNDVSNCKIILNGLNLEPVTCTKFLGINIDSKLQWGDHLKTLGSKLSSAAFAVKKIRKLTDEATARLVYFSYFHSLMSYGIILWGSAAEVESIFILQKRAVRAIYKMSPRDSLREMFKNIKILTLPSLYIFENILYVKKNINIFSKKSDVHTVNTRNKDKLSVPVLRLQKSSKSFIGNSVKFYNKIPNSITCLNYHKFKKHIKNILIQKAYYKIEDYVQDKSVWK